MIRCAKGLVMLVGVVALLQVPGVRPWMNRAQQVATTWVSKVTSSAPGGGPSLQSEMAEIEARLAEIKSESEKLGETAARSEREAERIGDILSRTRSDVVIVRADGHAEELAREDLKLEQAVCVVTGIAAKSELSALEQEGKTLGERHRQYKSQFRHAITREVAEKLAQLPRVDGKPVSGEKP